MKSLHKTIAADIALVVPAYCGLMLSGIPVLLRPFPLITSLPAFILSSAGLYGLAILIPSLLFSLWSPQLFRGEARFPKRSLILLAVLTVFTTVYFVRTWHDGLEYQGARFTYGICAANAGWLLLLWAIFISARARPSFNANLLAHFLLFAWLGWYAFPYLGELP
jgi:hypothetical protein